jgi:hypothetical protein
MPVAGALGGTLWMIGGRCIVAEGKTQVQRNGGQGGGGRHVCVA